MSSSDWRSLRDHREAVILGELGGLLHDWKKCMDWTIAGHWSNNSQLATKQQEWQKRKASGGPVVGGLSTLLGAIRIETVPESAPTDLKTLADKGSNPSQAEGDTSELVSLMGRCHDIAHVEKGLNSQTEQLETSSDRISTAFGYEHCEPDALLSRLDSAIRQYLQQPSLLVSSRSAYLTALAGVLSEAWGDTRRPANEVTLWDWSYAVASLYKSELARHFLVGGWRKREELRWRLLRVNFDVLDLYSRAIKIADLLGYRERIERACQALEHLIEDEYPLGNKVYRDTTGIYFTFPDIELPADLAQEICRLLEEVEPELAPRIQVGMAPGQAASEQLRRLLANQHAEARRELLSPFAPDNLSSYWGALWENLTERKWEVCPVCRLRPKDEENEACRHCESRRDSRVNGWHNDPKQTIWLDELADQNDRLALIVGKFGLDDWLSGDLVQTLLVKCDPSTNSFMPKNPSPARLRRVWETCQRFWETTVSSIFGNLPDGPRWELLPANPTDVRKLPEGIVCDGTLASQAISVFRIGNRLLSVSFCAQPNAGTLRVSAERGKHKQHEELEIQNAVQPSGNLAKYATYRPALTLLTSPDRFMALVPAENGVELASQLREAYLREFGKVQDRLPLFLGLVFFQRKTPLFAVMDTARRMMERVEFSEETWTVTGIQGDCVSFCNGYSWNVPTTMADGTLDFWYPYFFLDGDASGHTRRFQLKEEGLHNAAYQNRWLVHISDLKGKRVRVSPSRFAYLFLQHSAQRFEFDPDRHAMYLDELPRLVCMWEQICRTRDMTDTKLRAVADLLQIKGERWGAKSDEFKGLVETTLRQAGLWEGGDKGAVVPGDVTSGRFHRCLAIYLRILKQRVKEERHEQHASVTV